MGQKYAGYDERGVVWALFDSDANPKTIATIVAGNGFVVSVHDGSAAASTVTLTGALAVSDDDYSSIVAAPPGSYTVDKNALVPPALPTDAELAAEQVQLFQSSCIAAVQKLLDGLAQSWGYDSVISAASYATSGSVQFSAEARALIDWRDSVWAWGYAQLAAIQSGAVPMPSDAASFLASVPAAPARPTVSDGSTS